MIMMMHGSPESDVSVYFLQGSLLPLCLWRLRSCGGAGRRLGCSESLAGLLMDCADVSLRPRVIHRDMHTRGELVCRWSVCGRDRVLQLHHSPSPPAGVLVATARVLADGRPMANRPSIVADADWASAGLVQNNCCGSSRNWLWLRSNSIGG